MLTLNHLHTLGMGGLFWLQKFQCLVTLCNLHVGPRDLRHSSGASNAKLLKKKVTIKRPLPHFTCLRGWVYTDRMAKSPA